MIRALLLSLLLGGCVNQALLDSYRGYHEQSAEWLRYVEADPELDDADKRARVLLYRAAGRVIEEAGR